MSSNFQNTRTGEDCDCREARYVTEKWKRTTNGLRGRTFMVKWRVVEKIIGDDFFEKKCCKIDFGSRHVEVARIVFGDRELVTVLFCCARRCDGALPSKYCSSQSGTEMRVDVPFSTHVLTGFRGD